MYYFTLIRCIIIAQTISNISTMALNKSNINKLNEFLAFLEKASNYLTDNDLSSWFCLDPRKARPQYIKEFNARSLPNFIAKAVGDVPASEVEQHWPIAELER